MHKCVELANQINFNGVTFNGCSNIVDAIKELDQTFDAETFGRQSYISAVVYNMLNDMRGNRDLSIYEKLETPDSLNIMYDTSIQIEQFSPHNFNYYQCVIDHQSFEANIIDDFDFIIANIDVKDLMLNPKHTVPIAEAVKQLLINKGLLSQHDVVTIDEED